MSMTKISSIMKILVVVSAAALMALALVACGPKELAVTVVDNGQSSELTATEGETVGELLSDAGITVNDGDVVTPSLDTIIEGEDTTVTIERVMKVIIEADGKNMEVTLLEGTVQDALDAAGITLNEGDVVNPGLDTVIEGEGLTVTVERVKNVAVAVDGQNIDVALLDGTVQDALDAAGITLGDGDTVDVEVATPIEDGMLITVTRYVPEPEPEPAADTSEKKSSSSKKKSSSSSEKKSSSSEKSVVSKTKVPNCNDDGHGYYEITWSDGSTTYEEY